MKKSVKNIILGLLGFSFLTYVVLQAVGLYQIYKLVAYLLEPMQAIVIKNMGTLLLQTVIMVFLWIGLWRDKQWCRYILYFVTVVLYAYGVSVLPLIQETFLSSTTWLRYAYIALLVYYLLMGVTCLIYLFHPDVKVHRKPLNYD